MCAGEEEQRHDARPQPWPLPPLAFVVFPRLLWLWILFYGHHSFCPKFLHSIQQSPGYSGKWRCLPFFQFPSLSRKLREQAWLPWSLLAMLVPSGSVLRKGVFLLSR